AASPSATAPADRTRPVPILRRAPGARVARRRAAVWIAGTWHRRRAAPTLVEREGRMLLAHPKPALAVASDRRFRLASAKLVRQLNPRVEEPSACALHFYQRAPGNPAADTLEVPLRCVAEGSCLCDLGEHCEIGSTEHRVLLISRNPLDIEVPQPCDICETN